MAEPRDPLLAELCELHASEASFLWPARDRAARAPHYDLSDLEALDERLEANLDGLRLAGATGRQACEDALASAALLSASAPDGAEGAGELFTFVAVAVEHRAFDAVARAIALSEDRPDLEDALVAALAWLPFDEVEPLLAGLLPLRMPPRLQRLGIALSAAHRVDVVGLPNAILDRDEALACRAIRAAGELGRMDLAEELRGILTRPTGDDRRFWAAWSLALLGDRSAPGVLWEHAQAGGPHARRAALVAARAGEPRVGKSKARALSNARLGLVAAAGIGDPELVPWLIDAAADDALVRPAAEAFALLTGADLEASDLRAPLPPPEGRRVGEGGDADEALEPDPDEDVPMTDASALWCWWSQHRARFQPSQRYLLGRPLDRDCATHALHHGRQRARAEAAVELALRTPGKPLFEVRAPAFRQRAWLG